MASVYETSQARRDIFEAFFQIALDNEAAASALKTHLKARFQTLADNPEMGVSRPEFGRGVRMFPFENTFIIVYRPVSDGVEVLRFFHGARDIEARL